MIKKSDFGDKNSVTNFISNNELGQIPVSRVQPQEAENTIKTDKLWNSSKKETKQNNDKAFKVKHTKYTNAQKNFIVASHNLKNSYETIKRIQMNLSPDTNNSQFEELHVIVKNMIEKVFGIKFSEISLKKQHKQCVFNNVPKPLSININDTSGGKKLDLVIKEAFEDVWKYILEISETNTKYYFWLRDIIEPNEFCELYDAREYLIQNMINEKDRIEQLQNRLNDFYNNLQMKLMNIVNEVVEILKHKKYKTEENKNVIKNKNSNPCKRVEKNVGKNFQTIIDEHKHEINMKIKTLEMENEKMKNEESDNCRQIQTLFDELTLSSKKLENAKESIAWLLEENNDLISIIEETEVKKENLQTLQHKLEMEQEKNRHLRDILVKEFDE